MDSLTERERAMLAMEAQRWDHVGAKEAAIVERFGISVVRYYQQLNALIRREAALAHDPVLVNRLSRLAAR